LTRLPPEQAFEVGSALLKIYPPKLKPGDEVRVIAPSTSLTVVSDYPLISRARFSSLGLNLSFGEHVRELDDFDSSSIASRVQDLHAAFEDPAVKAVMAATGGFNCNQLLRYLDWELIKNNPKIFCGFSDITALNNAILAKTGLVSYSGPAYSDFGQELHFDYALDYFRRCLFDNSPIEITPSQCWSDDSWFEDQKERRLITNGGFWVFNAGLAEGTIIGGNLCTLNLLQGTEYFPDLSGSILFLEDDYESLPHTFDRDLQSLIHLPSFAGVRGIVIGRFQKASQVTRELLAQIVRTKKELDSLPVIGNVDFGHSDPRLTFPVGGVAHLAVTENTTQLIIQIH
jgi:muramoyltetrapeptide carboxypeptidase